MNARDPPGTMLFFTDVISNLQKNFLSLYCTRKISLSILRNLYKMTQLLKEWYGCLHIPWPFNILCWALDAFSFIYLNFSTITPSLAESLTFSFEFIKSCLCLHVCETINLTLTIIPFTHNCVFFFHLHLYFDLTIFCSHQVCHPLV